MNQDSSRSIRTVFGHSGSFFDSKKNKRYQNKILKNSEKEKNVFFL